MSLITRMRDTRKMMNKALDSVGAQKTQIISAIKKLPGYGDNYCVVCSRKLLENMSPSYHVLSSSFDKMIVAIEKCSPEDLVQVVVRIKADQLVIRDLRNPAGETTKLKPEAIKLFVEMLENL